jgi:hypothetical protein
MRQWDGSCGWQVTHRNVRVRRRMGRDYYMLCLALHYLSSYLTSSVDCHLRLCLALTVITSSIWSYMSSWVMFSITPHYKIVTRYSNLRLVPLSSQAMFSSIRHSRLSPVLVSIACDTQVVRYTNARQPCMLMTDSI